jgi:FkbM family methyltransferase
MSVKKFLINNVLTRFAFKKSLPYMPREMIQRFMGMEALSPIEQFAFRGYNNFLFSDLKVEEDESVLVLGGYLGFSISKFRNLYNCHIVAVEPIREFSEYLQETYKSDDKVQIFEFAVSDRDGTLELGLEGESTGINSNSAHSLILPTRDISEFLLELNLLPKVVEMNIEGGEYRCLERLIETNQITKIHTLLVQFHKFGLEEEVQRSKIRLALDVTHICEYEFPWVWERWELRR